MYPKSKNYILFIFLLSVNCKVKQDTSNPDVKAEHTINVSSSKEMLDIPYSDHLKNTFDIYLPPSADNTPLVIFVHGGGFTGGDKRPMPVKLKKEKNSFLTNKIAFASINYRLLEQNDTIGVKKSLSDVKNCLQFIRQNASKYNIDKTRIGLYGSSAGAGSVLWLGLHDDMAEKDAQNPVMTESTRVKAIALYATQATYDLEKWKTEVFSDSPMTIEDITNILPKNFKKLYGIKNIIEYQSQKIAAYRKEVDMLDLMTSDDPPLWIESENPTIRLDNLNVGQLYHHYKHSETLQKQAKKVGIVHYVHLKAINQKTENWTDVVSFFKNYL